MSLCHRFDASACEFFHGLSCIDVNDRPGHPNHKMMYGFVDREGTMRIPPVYEAGEDFRGGLAAMLGVPRKIVDHCLLENHWTQHNMVEILKGISTRPVPEFGGTPLDFSSDQLNAYGGRQGQKKLIEIVEAGISEVHPDFGIEKGIAGE